MMNTYLIEFEDLALITPLSNEEYGGQPFYVDLEQPPNPSVLYIFRRATK